MKVKVQKKRAHGANRARRRLLKPKKLGKMKGPLRDYWAARGVPD